MKRSRAMEARGEIRGAGLGGSVVVYVASLVAAAMGARCIYGAVDFAFGDVDPLKPHGVADVALVSLFGYPMGVGLLVAGY